jgi:hypothetical protein
MVNILEVLGVVAVPVGQTVATALVGAALAHPRIGAITIEGKATLCKVRKPYPVHPCAHRLAMRR